MKHLEARIVFVGDERVGKSTLINGIISYFFTEEVMHVFPVVTIPAGATTYNIVLHIVDTGVDDDYKAELEAEIKRADVVVMIYSVESVESILNIYNSWLPKVRGLLGERSKGVPVLLVGNKADLKGTVEPSINMRVEEVAHKINREFQEVEVWLECSAKTMMNTNDLLFYAQKSAVCPQRVIFDSATGQLTEDCKVALERIFRLCDKDGDGILDDQELNDFQATCFGGSLEPQELDSVKNMVRGRCPQGVTSRGLNTAGFLALQTIFIHDSQPEIPWTVLRKFGYGLDLKLTEEFLNPVLNVSQDQSAELSGAGIGFFTALFRRYDKDGDSALSSTELKDLFSTTPGIPWDKSFLENAVTDFSGNITLRGFLSMWTMTTMLDYPATLRYLAYLGCENPKESLSFPHHPNSKSKSTTASGSANALLAYVFGESGTGKTTLLKRFVEKPFYDTQVATTSPLSVANTVSIDGAEKYLVLVETPVGDYLLNKKAEMNKCDVAVLLFDGHSKASFSHLQPVYHTIQTEFPSLPCVFVQTKSDLVEVLQDFKVSPSVFFNKNKNLIHTTISTKTERPDKLFEDLVMVALGRHEKSRGVTTWKRKVGLGLTITIVIGGLVVAGRFLWKAWRK